MEEADEDIQAEGGGDVNYINAQKQIFNNIVSGDRVCGYWIDDNRFFVTGDAFHGFVFPKEMIAFDTKKVNEIKKLFDFDTDAIEENEVTETDNFKLVNRKMMRVFLRKDGRGVYVNTQFLKHFQNAKYYQTDIGKPLLIVEEIRGKQFPVGVALPIRYHGEWDKVTLP